MSAKGGVHLRVYPVKHSLTCPWSRILDNAIRISSGRVMFGMRWRMPSEIIQWLIYRSKVLTSLSIPQNRISTRLETLPKAHPCLLVRGRLLTPLHFWLFCKIPSKATLLRRPGRSEWATLPFCHEARVDLLRMKGGTPGSVWEDYWWNRRRRRRRDVEVSMD